MESHALVMRKATSEESYNQPVKKYLEKLLDKAKGPLLDVGSNPFAKTYIPEHLPFVSLNWTREGLPHKGERVQADALHLPFPDGSFPIVLSKQALGYLSEPQFLLEEMVRVTDRDGLFLLIDVEGDIARHDQNCNKDIARLHDFDPKEVELQVYHLGLTYTNVTTIHTWQDVEIAPGVFRNLALTCVSGVKR